MRQTQVRVQDRRRVVVDTAGRYVPNRGEERRRKVANAMKTARQFAGPDYRRGAETWGYV